MRLSDISHRLEATLLRDGEFQNLGFFFDDLPDKLLFVEDPRFVPAALASKGRSCILCTPELAHSFRQGGLATTLEPRKTFFDLQQLLAETEFYWNTFATEIHPSARIHPRAYVAPVDVKIGAETTIEANVVVGERTLIGSGVTIRAGTVIGTEGFQPGRYPDRIMQMVHAGGVAIDNNARIFANVVIARAVFRQMTTIGEHAQIGNGAFVSHNVQIGKRCFVGHNCTINGSTSIGDDAWIGPNSTISNLLTIGERARVSLGAVVIQSVAPDAHLTGMAAAEHRRMLRHVASTFPRRGPG
jgi:UDP-3-O-[3-hydroxymyristoyl] glucosamine N-acyltransferase